MHLPVEFPGEIQFVLQFFGEFRLCKLTEQLLLQGMLFVKNHVFLLDFCFKMPGE